MGKKMFKKNCPKCGCVMSYSIIYDCKRSIKLNILCRSCSSQKKAGKDYTINKKTGCWEWNRKLINSGYGVKNFRGKFYLAHRFYYEIYKGKIKKNLEIDHLCRNRKCCNPEHLEAVTKAVNQRRGLKSRLKEEQVREIRKIGSKMTQREIAKKFNVNQKLIFNILHKLTWKKYEK